ncbi:MAG: T9SS type A sorting domain-containing protein [Ignavibacteriales bacterium]|nr:T9SS type A sorting domain-containing protein [Ignavibacteriales bacterium]
MFFRNFFIAILMLFVVSATAQERIKMSSRASELCSQKKMSSEYAFLPGKANIRHTYDVLHYKIYLDIYGCFISPYPKTYSANVEITLAADSAINFIDLHAVNTSLQINSVGLSGSSYTHSSNNLRVTLNRTYQPGETLNVKINYNHLSVSDGAVNVSGGFFFTDCEPEGARKWVPCYDKPSDKATMELTARVPATVKLGSNGRLADSTKNVDTIYYHWVSRDPVATYLMVVSAKVNYNLDIVYWKKLSNPNDSIPIRFYYNAGENISSAKQIIGPMTTFFSTKFGEHPFEKNGFATLNNQFTWGGMENQTLTSLCPGCWGENLISHEYAHQWFGDMITCATWADITLNEGFATYCEALWLENTNGYTSYKNDINSDASGYLGSNPGWAIYNPSWITTTPNTNTLFNTAVTYYKGACVLHMLRYVMGDQLFFQGIKTYATNPDLKYRSAVITDLKNVMSTAYGQDLSWFFDAWYSQPNHPTYANKYFFQQSGSGWVTGFIANQTQANSAFHQMPLTIKIGFSNGTDTTVRVMNTYNNQQFMFNSTKQPTSVVFDPNNDIVLKTATLGTTTAGPALVSPVNNSGGQPSVLSLSWNAVSSAVSYRVIVATDAQFANVVVYDTLVATTSKFVSLPIPAKYYWKVNAKLSASNSPWSDTWNFTVGTNCRDLNLSTSWNLVSVPLNASNMTASVLFPTATSPAYAYNNGYIQTQQLLNGAGYWLRYDAPTVVSICGEQVTAGTINLNAGWNLIGGYGNDLSVATLSTIPAGIVNSSYFGYQGGYAIASDLGSGKGYWVRATQSGVLVIPVVAEKTAAPTTSAALPKQSISVTDANGNKTILYLVSGNENMMQYDLPPVPPQGVFDVRFTEGRVAAPVAQLSQISLNGCQYPVTVTLQNINGRLSDIAGGKLFNATAKSGEKIIIADPSLNILSFEGSVIPAAFALEQNYPNPFNPSTQINYSLGNATKVSLRVFDMLGNEVAVLVDKQQEAGNYSVELHASKLASGVYIYRLDCNDFHAVKKLTVLK